MVLPTNVPVNAVIDLSHWNTVTSFVAIKADGIAGVVHKATQGMTYVDPTYAQRQIKATVAGLRWGAYHFGTGDDPIAQVDHFLSTVKPDTHTLLALDLESNPNGLSMSRANAEQFVTEVHRRLGRWPILYTGAWYVRNIMFANTITALSNCPLWIASYIPQPDIPPQWTTWKLWQYTDGQSGPAPWGVHGVEGHCDRNKFNGTMDELLTFWDSQ